MSYVLSERRYEKKIKKSTDTTFTVRRCASAHDGLLLDSHSDHSIESYYVEPSGPLAASPAYHKIVNINYIINVIYTFNNFEMCINIFIK